MAPGVEMLVHSLLGNIVTTLSESALFKPEV